jgi:hypothetical protein
MFNQRLKPTMPIQLLLQIGEQFHLCRRGLQRYSILRITVLGSSASNPVAVLSSHDHDFAAKLATYESSRVTRSVNGKSN